MDIDLILLTILEIIIRICQFLAMIVIIIGVVKAIFIFMKDSIFGKKAQGAIQESRLELGHSFSLGVGFLIGVSILTTTELLHGMILDNWW